MAVSYSQTAVATSATLLVTGETGNGVSGLIRNRGAAAIFVGDSAVTTSTGFQLDAGETMSADVYQGEALYAVCASGTVVTHVLANSSGS